MFHNFFILLLIYFSQVSFTHLSSWSFTKVWVIESLLRSLGLLCVPQLFHIVINLLLASFFHPFKQLVFHKSLSDHKFPRVSWTLLSFLADLKDAIVWRVSILRLISSSTILSSKLLETVQRAPTIIGIAITLMFHSFLVLRQRPSICRVDFFLSFILTQLFARTAKSSRWQIFFSFLCC